MPTEMVVNKEEKDSDVVPIPSVRLSSRDVCRFGSSDKAWT